METPKFAVAPLAQVRRRTEQACLNKLDGKITEVFWAKKSSEWNQEEQQILMALSGLEQIYSDHRPSCCSVVHRVRHC